MSTPCPLSLLLSSRSFSQYDRPVFHPSVNQRERGGERGQGVSVLNLRLKVRFVLGREGARVARSMRHHDVRSRSS